MTSPRQAQPLGVSRAVSSWAVPAIGVAALLPAAAFSLASIVGVEIGTGLGLLGAFLSGLLAPALLVPALLKLRSTRLAPLSQAVAEAHHLADELARRDPNGVEEAPSLDGSLPGRSSTPAEDEFGRLREIGRLLRRELVRSDETTKQLRLLEEQLQRARADAGDSRKARSNFLATLSHELRTPMTLVLGHTEMMLEEMDEGGEPSPLMKDDLHEILRASQALLETINSLIAMAEAEDSSLVLRRDPVQVADMLGRVVDTHRPLAAANGNAVKVEVESDLRPVMADSKQLERILSSLVSNACKFTSSGTVTVAARREAGPGGRLKISVHDTGIGMTAADQVRVFAPFVQAEDADARHFGGTGLGLAIAKRLVELMGGQIDLRSTLGRGSTFTVALALAPIEADSIGPQEPAPLPMPMRTPAATELAATDSAGISIP